MMMMMMMMVTTPPILYLTLIHPDSPEVVVLKGGFKSWQEHFANSEPSLITPLPSEDP